MSEIEDLTKIERTEVKFLALNTYGQVLVDNKFGLAYIPPRPVRFNGGIDDKPRLNIYAAENIPIVSGNNAKKFDPDRKQRKRPGHVGRLSIKVNGRESMEIYIGRDYKIICLFSDQQEVKLQLYGNKVPMVEKLDRGKDLKKILEQTINSF